MRFKIGDHIKCIDDENSKYVVYGKSYKVIEIPNFKPLEIDPSSAYIYINNEEGFKGIYSANRFTLDIEYYRRQKLKSIGL